MKKISKICLGTAQFGLEYGINNQGGKPNEAEVFKILDYAHLKGISSLDSADTYGSALETLGKYNSEVGVKYNINSKFSSVDRTLQETLAQSLVKLNLDSVSVYYFHDYSQFACNPEYHEQIINLKREGLIEKIGLSVYDNSEFQDACGYDFIDVIQFPFNLLDNSSHRGTLIDLAVKNGKQLYARSIYLQGLFFMDTDTFPRTLTPLAPHIQQLQRIAENENISIGQLALNYVLQNKNIDYAIIGVDSIEQLNQNLSYAGSTISDKIIQDICKIHVKETELLYPKNW
jgi:aryl-alcohol dehydrogenase-like predicted oxidoreductase